MVRGIDLSDAGFSLLELVVVVAVMAILSITAVFSVGRTHEPVLNDAARFQAAYDRQRDAAIFSRSTRAMALSLEGWQGLERADTEDGETGWRPAGVVQRFKGEARFRGKNGAFDEEAWEGEPVPDLVFLPDGQVTPFEVSFISTELVTRCTGSGWTGMSCDK